MSFSARRINGSDASIDHPHAAGVLASASAHAPNWGKSSDPFNDGTDTAPVHSSWRADLNVTIDCPK